MARTARDFDSLSNLRSVRRLTSGTAAVAVAGAGNSADAVPSDTIPVSAGEANLG